MYIQYNILIHCVIYINMIRYVICMNKKQIKERMTSLFASHHHSIIIHKEKKSIANENSINTI